MKKLPLIIRGDTLRANHLTIGNWKFYKVKFKSIKNSFNSEMLSRLKRIGTSIREVDFDHCYVSKQKVFQNILRNFPKLEKLTFESCSFRFRYQKSKVNVLKLQNLNELELNNSCLMVNYNFNQIINYNLILIFYFRCFVTLKHN